MEWLFLLVNFTIQKSVVVIKRYRPNLSITQTLLFKSFAKAIKIKLNFTKQEKANLVTQEALKNVLIKLFNLIFKTMKNKSDYCEIDPFFKFRHVKKRSKPKVSHWTKLTTVLLEIAALIGAIQAIVEFINLVLPFFTR